MKPLLDDRFAPTTHAAGFLASPFDTVAKAVLEWQRSLFAGVEAQAVDAPLPDALQHLAPRAAPADRLLLLQTRSDWVACFDNGQQGSDPAGLVGHLCTLLKCRGLVVNWRPGHGRDLEGLALGLRLYAAAPRAWLNIERNLSLVNDDGEWRFESSGDVQTFEQTQRYRTGEMRERFTPEMLVGYTAELGIALTDPAFYGPKGRLVTHGRALAGSELPASVRETRRQLGLQD